MRVLGSVALVLGLDLSIKLFPGGPPLRDAAHRALLHAFRAMLHPRLSVQTEVPIPIPGDQRAWDVVIRGAGPLIGVEAEMALRDCQRLERRIALKQRDSGIGRVVLLAADTRSNREAIRVAGPMLRDAFPVSARVAREALRAARDPGGSAILLVPVGGPSRALSSTRSQGEQSMQQLEKVGTQPLAPRSGT